MHLPKFSDIHISHQIHRVREGITRTTNSSSSGERPEFVPRAHYFSSLFKFFYQLYRKERPHLLGISVSLFEATEIQDMMNTRITLQCLCTKFSRVSRCVHPQHIGLVHLYNHLSNTVSEVSVQENPTRNTGVLQIKIKIKNNTCF